MSDDEKEFDEWLKRAAEGSGEKIKNSGVFISLFNEAYKKDPLACLQLGIAIMMDKPIVIIADSNASIPKALKKIASYIGIADSPKEAANLIKEAVKSVSK